MCFHRRRIPRHLLLQPATPNPGYGRVVKWFVILLVTVTATVIAAVARAVPHTEAPVFSNTLSPTGMQTGALLFKDGQGRFAPALHHDSEADVVIKGMLAKVVLRQRFENTGDHWLEGVYVFPLGETAAVSRMIMEVGERRLVAQIREREEAAQIYQQAQREGRRAALTEQERPNLFTQSVANIGPGEVITIELHFHETVSFRDNTFSWRLPTTLTPRYIPGMPTAAEDVREVPTNGWAQSATQPSTQPTAQVPDAQRISPFFTTDKDAATNPIRIQLRLDAGLPLAEIHGSYHQLRLHKSADTHWVNTVPEVVPMDRDFEISWRTPAGKAPDTALFIEQQEGHDYALLMLLPPQQQQAQTLPREVIFVIDTSGSMGGTSIAQAKASLQLALARLQPQDRFNIIEFNSRHRPLFIQAESAGASELAQARQFVQRLKAEGGTEMRGALAVALREPAPSGFLKQVIFITDGSVGNETELFQLIHQQLGEARLFTVGIGSAPNSYFMRKAAEFGRGTFTFVGSQHEVAEKMQTLFLKLESPVLSDIHIQWPAGVAIEAWPQRVPDLYHGEPLSVSFKVNGELPAHSVIHISGQQATQHWSRQLNVTAGSRTEPAAGVAVRWARNKITALLDEKVRGRHEDEVRADVLQLALQHQLLSPYTSFVAVEDHVSRPAHAPTTIAPVANLLPHGQRLQTIGYPQTATSAPLQLVLGLLALCLLLGLRWHSRRGRGV